MKPVRARYFFRGFAILCVFFSLYTAYLSYISYYFSTQQSYLLMLIGGILIFISFIGPTRIRLLKPRIPIEILRSISIVGFFLPLAGVSFLISGSFPFPFIKPICYGIISVSFIWIGLLGFYRLSYSLPIEFYMDELLNIIKSAHLFGPQNENLADRAYKEWTHGYDGVDEASSSPNGEVIDLKGNTLQLLDYINTKAPNAYWVINFGSYTCPHHRKHLDELHDLMKEWQPKGIHFLTLYTAEAHPEDGWRLESQYQYDEEYTGRPNDFTFYQPKTISDRLKMARWLIEKKQFKMPVLLDNMNNSLLRDYNAWPIRLYVIKNNHVVYCGDQGPFGYNPCNLSERLHELLGNDA